MKSSGGTGTAARRTGAHWSALCILRSGSPKDAVEAAQERPTILIDCVTLWVSNILFALPEPEDLTAFETAVRTEVNALLALM